MTSESDTAVSSTKKQSWQSKAMSVEWLGQTIASICWINSVFLYGISSSGDWFQLLAGFSWLVANISSLTKV